MLTHAQTRPASLRDRVAPGADSLSGQTSSRRAHIVSSGTPGMTFARGVTLALAILVSLIAPDAVRAQDGPGTAAAPVLQIQAGSRAAALAGAYTAATDDVDVLFYNPAGLAGLGAGASLAYERRVEGITFGSGGAAIQLGPLVVALGAAYLDAGEVDEIIPDPAFGGQRGIETGDRVGARESAVRVSAAHALGALRVGASAGYVSSDLAGVTRSAAIVDLGAQYIGSRFGVGASLLNLGDELSGGDGVDAPLPREARAGLHFDVFGRDAGPSLGSMAFGLLLAADVIRDFGSEVTTLATGAEARFFTDAERRLGGALRLGWAHHSDTDDHLGRLRLGLGLSFERIALDYTYQDFDYFGAIHRFGLRWSRPAR